MRNVRRRRGDGGIRGIGERSQDIHLATDKKPAERERERERKREENQAGFAAVKGGRWSMDWQFIMHPSTKEGGRAGIVKKYLDRLKRR